MYAVAAASLVIHSIKAHNTVACSHRRACQRPQLVNVCGEEADDVCLRHDTPDGAVRRDDWHGVDPTAADVAVLLPDEGLHRSCEEAGGGMARLAMSQVASGIAP